MARRGRGEGSIKHRSDGRWEASVTLGDQRRSFYGKTRGEVVRKLGQAQRDYEQGLLIGDARQTMEQYLADWLESKRPPEVRASTWVGYERHVRNHIAPVVGRVKLGQLTPQHVQQVTSRCFAQGLSSSSVAEIYGVLRRALKAAVRLGLVAQNVTDRTSPPRRKTAEIHPLTREETQRFLASVEAHWLAPLFNLALSTGMRIGELLALKWRDVDLDVGQLSVVASMRWEFSEPLYTEPKSRRSRRLIKLHPEMVARLRAHRHQQRRQRLAAGPAWQGDRFDAVFTDELGFPLHDDRVRNQFYEALAAAGVPRRRFHDLRHTCASRLVNGGLPATWVQSYLRHADLATTLRYLHDDAAEQRKADAWTALGG